MKKSRKPCIACARTSTSQATGPWSKPRFIHAPRASTTRPKHASWSASCSHLRFLPRGGRTSPSTSSNACQRWQASR
jgi:hypothetical protein